MEPGAWTIYLPTVLLVAARVGGIFLLAPVFGASAIPARLRAFMSLVIALAVAGRLASPVPMPTHWVALAIDLGGELAVGATIGFAARVVLAGVELGAVQIGQQMGIALGEVFNPAATDATGILRRAMGLLAIVIFLIIGGHRKLIEAVIGSFRAIPPAGFSADPSLVNTIVAVLAASFTLALKVAAPVLIAMLLATVALGFLQKTIPQCNILSTGLPVRALVGLVVLAASIAAIAVPIEAGWQIVLDRVDLFLEDAR